MGRGRLWITLLLIILVALQITYIYYHKFAEEGEWTSDVKCECEGRLNCYTNGILCGKCFACVNTQPPKRSSLNEEDVVFALSTEAPRRAKLLVLIASIHKYYKDKKIVVFEDGNADSTEISMTLLRNVDFRRWDTTSVPTNVSAVDRMPFYINEVLGQHKSVVWLADDMEWKKDQFFEQLGAVTSHISTIGRTKLHWPSEKGFVNFFPGRINGARNFSALYARRSAKPLLEWMMACFRTLECASCLNARGDRISCSPLLLHRLSLDIPVSHMPLPPSLTYQQWEPPSCDFDCMLNFAMGVVFTITFLSIAICIASNNFIVDKQD